MKKQMDVFEQMRWMNIGINLYKQYCGKKDYCDDCGYYEVFKDMVASKKRIYCGTEDNVEFFETIISTLGLEKWIEY
jgi:hypothetical protein